MKTQQADRKAADSIYRNQFHTYKAAKVIAEAMQPEREAAEKLARVCNYIEEDGVMFNALDIRTAKLLLDAIATYRKATT